MPSGAGDIADGGQPPQAWGPPASTEIFSLGHSGVIGHLLAGSIDLGGVVHVAVHDRICVQLGVERLMPIFPGILRGEQRRGGVVPALQQVQQHAAPALTRLVVKPFIDRRQSEGNVLLQELVLPMGLVLRFLPWKRDGRSLNLVAPNSATAGPQAHECRMWLVAPRTHDRWPPVKRIFTAVIPRCLTVRLTAENSRREQPTISTVSQ